MNPTQANDHPTLQDHLHSPADFRQFTPLELSIVCSNLARGCEKQHRVKEAELFADLAASLAQKSAPTPVDADAMSDLLTRVNNDLASGVALAEEAAQAAPRDRGALRALTWFKKVSLIQKALLERREREGDAIFENTGVWVCTICGFIALGDAPPELCPVCKVPGWKFERVEGSAS